jgi:UDP-N-acetylglucosamine transferase subunit ALG13
MIVFTVGTNEQPFDRLVGAAAALGANGPLLVQYGSSVITGGPGRWIQFMPFEDLAREMGQATAVVCHAGVGSIMLARRCGHRPIVVPRRLHLDEAVDDHQLQLARRLHIAGIVRLVEDVEQLSEAIQGEGEESSAAPGFGEMPGAAALAADLGRFLDEVCAPRAPVPSRR